MSAIVRLKFNAFHSHTIQIQWARCLFSFFFHKMPLCVSIGIILPDLNRFSSSSSSSIESFLRQMSIQFRLTQHALYFFTSPFQMPFSFSYAIHNKKTKIHLSMKQGQKKIVEKKPFSFYNPIVRMHSFLERHKNATKWIIRLKRRRMK